MTYYLKRATELTDEEKVLCGYNDRWDEEYDSFLFELTDFEGILYVNRDGGEPEDQTFGRNWAWVVEELNKAKGISNDNKPNCY